MKYFSDMQNQKFFSKKRTLREVADRILILALMLATAGNGFVPVAAASVMPEAKKATAVPAAGNYLWQSVEAGELGGTEKSAQYAGYQFLLQKDAYATELCGYFKGTHAVNLYDENYKLLTSAQITGYEQWNCAAISPLPLAPQKKYFVVAEILTGPVYYRFGAANLLPRKGGDRVIEAGITQPINVPFGTKIKSATDRVFGLVDVKITSTKNAKALLGKTGSSLAEAVDGLSGSELRTGKTSGSEIAHNCARGKCIVCSESACRIEDDAQTKDQKENTFNQICLNGSCWSCTNGVCAMTDAAGIVKTGYSYKNCRNNECVNCLNGQCNIVGGARPRYLYGNYGFSGSYGDGAAPTGGWDAGPGSFGGGGDWGGGGGGGGVATMIAVKEVEIKTAFANGEDVSGLINELLEYLNLSDVKPYVSTEAVKGLSSSVAAGKTDSQTVVGAINQISESVAAKNAANQANQQAAAAKDQSQSNQNVNQLSTGPKAAVNSATASHSQDLLKEIYSGLSKTTVDSAGKVTTTPPENTYSNALTRPSSLASKSDGNYVAVKVTDPVSKGSTVPVPNQAFRNSDNSVTYVGKSSYTVSDAQTANIINTQHYILFPTSIPVPASDFNAVASSVKYGTGGAAVKVAASGGGIVGVYDPGATVSSIAAIGMPKQAAASTPAAATAFSDIFSWLPTASTGAGGQNLGALAYTGSTNGASTGSGSAPLQLGSKAYSGVVAGSVSTPVKSGGSGSAAANVNSQDIKYSVTSGMNINGVVENPANSVFERNTSLFGWGQDMTGTVATKNGQEMFVEVKTSGTVGAGQSLPAPIIGWSDKTGFVFNGGTNKAVEMSPNTPKTSAQANQISQTGSYFTPVWVPTPAKLIPESPAAKANIAGGMQAGVAGPAVINSQQQGGIVAAVITPLQGGGYIMDVNGQQVLLNGNFMPVQSGATLTAAPVSGSASIASKPANDPVAVSGSPSLTSSQAAFLGDTSGESYAAGGNAAGNTNSGDTIATDAASAQGNTAAAWLAQPDGSGVNLAGSNAIDGKTASQAATSDHMTGAQASNAVSCPACDAVELAHRASEVEAAQAGNNAALQFFQSGDPNANLALEIINLKNHFGLKNVNSWFGGIAAKVMAAIDKLAPKALAAVDDAQKISAGPAVIGYEPSITNNPTPTINIETGAKAVCKAAPYDLEYDFMWSVLAAADGKTHQMKFGELSDGNYVFYVRCQDEAGNTNRVSQRIAFTVDKNYDPKIDTNTMPPAVSGAKMDISDLAASLSVNAIGNVAVSEAEARIYGADGRLVATVLLSRGDNGNGWSHDWQGAVGAQAGNYTVDIFTKDVSGNFVDKKNIAAFTLKSIANENNFINGGDCKNLGSGGAAADKINLVFVPCGYGSDFKTFEKDAAIQMEQFSKISPVAQSLDKFNFAAVELPGLDCSAELADNIKKDTNLFEKIARPCNPTAVLVLKKTADSQGGISAPGSMTAFISAGSATAAIHEIGHIIFGLDDEYSYGCTYADMANSANCSDSPKCEKWQGLAGAGCFAGCTCEGNYRSSNDSVMLDPAKATTFSPAASQQVNKILNLFK